LAHPPYRELAGASLVRGLVPPHEQYFDDPSYEVCDCCGIESENDDNPGTGAPVAFEEYLSPRRTPLSESVAID
jgi:hypothetical protein